MRLHQAHGCAFEFRYEKSLTIDYQMAFAMRYVSEQRAHRMCSVASGHRAQRTVTLLVLIALFHTSQPSVKNLTCPIISHSRCIPNISSVKCLTHSLPERAKTLYQGCTSATMRQLIQWHPLLLFHVLPIT